MPNKTRKPAKPAKPSKPVHRVRLTEQATPPRKKASRTDRRRELFVLFGADEYGKPRAARFAADDPELLAKAAEALHVRLVEVTTPDMAALAAKLPTGRLHASGGGLVPHIKDSFVPRRFRREHTVGPRAGPPGSNASRRASQLGRDCAGPPRHRQRDPGMRLAGSDRR